MQVHIFMHIFKTSIKTLSCAHVSHVSFSEKKVQNRISKTTNHMFILVVKSLQKHELFPYMYVHSMLR